MSASGESSYSVLADLRGSRAFFAFLMMMLGASIAWGIEMTARSDPAPRIMASSGAVGLLGSVFMVAYAVVTFPAGIWVDRSRPRVILAATFVLLGILKMSPSHCAC